MLEFVCKCPHVPRWGIHRRWEFGWRFSVLEEVEEQEPMGRMEHLHCPVRVEKAWIYPLLLGRQSVEVRWEVRVVGSPEEATQKVIYPMVRITALQSIKAEAVMRATVQMGFAVIVRILVLIFRTGMWEIRRGFNPLVEEAEAHTLQLDLVPTRDL